MESRSRAYGKIIRAKFISFKKNKTSTKTHIGANILQVHHCEHDALHHSMGARSPSLFFDLGQIHIWAAKLIHNIKDEELSNEQILKRVNWRNLDYIYKHRILLIMHDIYHEKMPKCLTDIFQREEHSGTRQQLNFTIIRPKTEQGRTLLVVLENEILPDDNRS